jgi:2-polyprenyl-3-methyl-5-hydroxy-6-metoxy-1,4-benzoquinol methylase
MEDIFTKIYTSNAWASTESRSGPGSTLEQTKEIRERLPNIFKKLKIKTILDAPCGDFNWMKLIIGTDISYTGVDIVREVIDSNNQTYTTMPNVKFLNMNITKDKLPKVDLILCRDCLVHFNNKEIIETIKNFKKSGSKYLLTTSFPNRTKNRQDMQTGLWQPLNLQAPPFKLRKPLITINEKCTENNNAFSDKCLALWKLSDLYF